MDTRVDALELPPGADSRATNGSYQALEPGKVSGLHIPEIEAVAERLASELDFRPGDDLHNVVEKLGGELFIYDPSLDETRFSGTLVGKDSGSFRILVPARAPLPLENVIIAKELGHYFLHHIYSRAVRPDEASDPIALSNSEAEVFALCFLMPRAKFRKEMLGSDVATLASRYGIPETLVLKRQQLLDRGKNRA